MEGWGDGKSRQKEQYMQRTRGSTRQEVKLQFSFPGGQQAGVQLRVLFSSRSHPLPAWAMADWAPLCKPG